MVDRLFFLATATAVAAMLAVSASGCVRDGHLPVSSAATAQRWLSDPALDLKFHADPDGVELGAVTGAPTLLIDRAALRQEIDGFGFSLTGGSAYHLHRMAPGARRALLDELFGQGDARIGTSYLRVSIGASDLDEAVFSYADLPPGESDPELTSFSLDKDRRFLIPMLREILEIAPKLKIMASPWSPPVWMKTGESSVGGSLRLEFYDAYAAYFVRYIQTMADEGIPIDAITIQNEPLHPGNNPSMLMPAEAQAGFLKKSLGPAFAEAGLETKIILYDHNADRPDYPISILDDPDAKQYADGSAFHLYGGEIEALSEVHEAHPDRSIYFTEQWIGAPGDFPKNLRWHVRELIIGATRNWSRTVIEWNLAADENQDPHTPGGCTRCLGALTIEGDVVTRNPAYYIIAHASKFVRPGSVRIESSASDEFPNVAFLQPGGGLVVIVLNDTASAGSFNLDLGDGVVHSSLGAGAVATFVFPVPN